MIRVFIFVLFPFGVFFFYSVQNWQQGLMLQFSWSLTILFIIFLYGTDHVKSFNDYRFLMRMFCVLFQNCSLTGLYQIDLQWILILHITCSLVGKLKRKPMVHAYYLTSFTGGILLKSWTWIGQESLLSRMSQCSQNRMFVKPFHLHCKQNPLRQDDMFLRYISFKSHSFNLFPFMARSVVCC